MRPVLAFSLIIPLIGCSQPPPIGPLPVGRSGVDVALPDQETTLPLELWFAADRDEGEPDYMFSEELSQAMQDYLGLPKFAVPTGAKTRGLRGVDLAPGEPRPFVLFSHGFGSFAGQNTLQMEYLASHGTIVASVSYPGDSLTTEYEDGEIVPFDDQAPAYRNTADMDKDESRAYAEGLGDLLDDLRHASDLAAWQDAREAMRTDESFGVVTPVLDRQIDWMDALLVALPSVDDPVLNGVDWDRVGLMGHSLGGAVSMGVAARRATAGEPVQAVVSLDAPPITPLTEDVTFGAPTAVYLAHGTEFVGVPLSNEGIYDAVIPHAGVEGAIIELPDAAHQNFSDLSRDGIYKVLGGKDSSAA